MSLKYGKTEIATMAAVLDAGYETVEEAAAAAIGIAEEIFEKRAKFVVVGQLCGTKTRENIPPDDPEAIKLSLGWFSTEGDARSAAESLWYSSATGDMFRCWVLDVHHGTPAELHAKQKEKYAAIEVKRQEAKTERLKAQIAKRMEDDRIRAAGGKGACQCGHQQYDHSLVGQGRGKCWGTDCTCPKWDEKTK